MQHRDHAQLLPGVVEPRHLDGVFVWTAAEQRERDIARLANAKNAPREEAASGRRIDASSSR